MQFKVPQFLEIEDKIFGPFTFREFVYLAGGGGLCFVLYKLLGLWLGAIPILVMAGFSLALTFYKPNDKPFINMVEAGFNFILKDKPYIWKRRRQKKEAVSADQAGSASELGTPERVTRLSNSKLRDLAWSLDILDLSRHTENKMEGKL